ncbi:hypothetical protein [Neobacillus niacini]|uniref:hypothetical protein n=1 Tax=Neobacillus niacini TaxID=86668 RepID=UPI00285DE3CE|nr:hypothetical protein [Neobacillus niacini]MDR7000457.1 hypothetical protein [Neobacillus niacini]
MILKTNSPQLDGLHQAVLIEKQRRPFSALELGSFQRPINYKGITIKVGGYDAK